MASRCRLRQLAHQVVATAGDAITACPATSHDTGAATGTATTGAQDARLILTAAEGPLTLQQRRQYERDLSLIHI